MERIGLVGRGSLARVHARRYADIEDASVAALATPGDSEAFAREHAPAATVYDDVEELCEEADLDAVDVCTPTAARRGPVETAASHGLGVLCEAPIERTLEGALAIADAVEEQGITFLAGHSSRFAPAYCEARDQVDAGDIGTIGNVRTFRRGPSARYRDRVADGSDVLLDLAIHDFDFLRWVVGDVKRVFARRSGRDGSEYALTTLRFEDDTVGHVDTRRSSGSDGPSATRFELAGTDGLIEFDSEAADPVRIAGERGASDRGPVSVLGADPARREREHFVRCLASGQEPAVTLDDAVAAVRVSLAAVESARTGDPVAPSEVAP